MQWNSYHTIEYSVLEKGKFHLQPLQLQSVLIYLSSNFKQHYSLGFFQVSADQYNFRLGTCTSKILWKYPDLAIECYVLIMVTWIHAPPMDNSAPAPSITLSSLNRLHTHTHTLPGKNRHRHLNIKQIFIALTGLITYFSWDLRLTGHKFLWSCNHVYWHPFNCYDLLLVYIAWQHTFELTIGLMALDSWSTLEQQPVNFACTEP